MVVKEKGERVKVNKRVGVKDEWVGCSSKVAGEFGFLSYGCDGSVKKRTEEREEEAEEENRKNEREQRSS